MRITAIVPGNLKKKHCIDLYADDRYIADAWGKAKVVYHADAFRAKYCLIVNNGAAFFHVDAIQRYDPHHPSPK